MIQEIKRWLRYRSYKKNLISRLKESMALAPAGTTEIHMSSLIYKEFMRLNKIPSLEGVQVIECRANIPGSWDFR